MEVLAAVDIISTLLTTITNAVGQMNSISAMIQQAKAAGRTTFTEAEWVTIQDAQVSSRAALLDAITKALK